MKLNIGWMGLALGGAALAGCGSDAPRQGSTNNVEFSFAALTAEGVDVSPVAIAAATDAARQADARVTFLATDLDRWQPRVGEYDLIVVHRFLDRVHIPLWIPAALRPGGHLLYGTFLIAQGSAGAGVGPQNPAYRLQPGELRQLYASLEVVESLEGEGFTWLHARRGNRKN